MVTMARKSINRRQTNDKTDMKLFTKSHTFHVHGVVSESDDCHCLIAIRLDVFEIFEWRASKFKANESGILQNMTLPDFLMSSGSN